MSCRATSQVSSTTELMLLITTSYFYRVMKLWLQPWCIRIRNILGCEASSGIDRGHYETRRSVRNDLHQINKLKAANITGFNGRTEDDEARPI